MREKKEKNIAFFLVQSVEDDKQMLDYSVFLFIYFLSW